MKIVKQIAEWILRYEIKASDQILVNQSKLIHLLVSNNDVNMDRFIEIGLQSASILHRSAQTDKENSRLQNQLYEKGKLVMPKKMFIAISEWMPDPNFVAVVNTKTVNDELCRHVFVFSDSLGNHKITGKVFDNEPTCGYNDYNIKHLVIQISDYNFHLEIQLVKREVRYCINGCESEIKTHVWALGDNVQLISEQAFDVVTAFIKVQRDIILGK